MLSVICHYQNPLDSTSYTDIPDWLRMFFSTFFLNEFGKDEYDLLLMRIGFILVVIR
jgi:hypothetical protein